MNKKLSFSVLLFALVLVMVGVGSAKVVSAADAIFPAGCASALGYSATSGHPCSGTSTVIPRYMAGCTTPLGYSATTGLPCSGSSVAILWLAGCTSLLGYSAITGEACNGTAIATLAYVPPVQAQTPGLPTTGAGGNASLNIALLLSSGFVALSGFMYLVRRHSGAK